VAKLGVRDLPVATALGRSGATTVSSTALLAAQAGIAVFATGGLGGVHRQAGDTFDESADLVALARTSLVVVANPLPPDEQLAPDVHDRVIAEALAAAEAAGVRGKDVAPFLLDHLHRSSAGASLAVNVRLVLRNAELAGQIAVELAALPR
jgi:pseudouridine-5'-phosphate glycosidase